MQEQVIDRVKYPDGQISAKVWNLQAELIKMRVSSYEDLFYLKSVAEVWKYSGGRMPKLFIPCLFGQRSDRRFSENQSFDLKIIADFINSCKFRRVQIFDPHSDVGPALIDRSQILTSYECVKSAVSNIEDRSTDEVVLVSPDAGAYKKVFDYGEKLNLEVTAAVKHRDKKGEITLKFIGDVKDKECLIVDDLCDGGRTFIALGKQLKEQGAKKVYLYVSHGIFSNGFRDLSRVIDHIFCTNSVNDLPESSYENPGMFYCNSNHSDGIPDYITQFKII